MDYVYDGLGNQIDAGGVGEITDTCYALGDDVTLRTTLSLDEIALSSINRARVVPRFFKGGNRHGY